jgi:hypothetical protein
VIFGTQVPRRSETGMGESRSVIHHAQSHPILVCIVVVTGYKVIFSLCFFVFLEKMHIKVLQKFLMSVTMVLCYRQNLQAADN